VRPDRSCDCEVDLMALKLTPVAPVSSQRDFFSGEEDPVYPRSTASDYGDPLRSMLIEFAIGGKRAADALGITVDDLTKAQSGGFTFDLGEARRLLRGGAR
jgi:hypothetical protein